MPGWLPYEPNTDAAEPSSSQENTRSRWLPLQTMNNRPRRRSNANPTVTRTTRRRHGPRPNPLEHQHRQHQVGYSSQNRITRIESIQFWVYSSNRSDGTGAGWDTRQPEQSTAASTSRSLSCLDCRSLSLNHALDCCVVGVGAVRLGDHTSLTCTSWIYQLRCRMDRRVGRVRYRLDDRRELGRSGLPSRHIGPTREPALGCIVHRR